MTADVAALKRAATPARPTFEPIKWLIQWGEVRDMSLFKIKYLQQNDYVLQLLFGFTEAVPLFTPKAVNDDLPPAGEPAAGGIARVCPRRFLARGRHFSRSRGYRFPLAGIEFLGLTHLNL